jgi:hypothetical protein
MGTVMQFGPLMATSIGSLRADDHQPSLARAKLQVKCSS